MYPFVPVISTSSLAASAIAARRGASAFRPEHTLASFEIHPALQEEVNFNQSVEVANLKALRKMTGIRLVQLIDNPKNPPVANGALRNQPYDFTLAGDKRRYADLTAAAGLLEIATYADIVRPYKEAIIPRTAANELGVPTAFVRDAHQAGLLVHLFAMRPKNLFLPALMRRANVDSTSAHGNLQAELAAYLEAGIDGFFTDDSAEGRIAINAFFARKKWPADSIQTIPPGGRRTGVPLAAT